MEFEKVKSKLGSWADRFRPFIESNDFDKIFIELKKMSGQGCNIYPNNNDTFKPFSLTDINNLTAIIICEYPYYDIIPDGLALSCSKSEITSSLLVKVYEEIKRQCKISDSTFTYANDLSFLAEQGFLLLNLSLTTELDKPGGHISIWSDFINFLITKILNIYVRPVPILLLGKMPSSLLDILFPFQYHVFHVEDPTNNDHWDNCDYFNVVENFAQEFFPKTIKWLSS